MGASSLISIERMEVVELLYDGCRPSQINQVTMTTRGSRPKDCEVDVCINALEHI